MAMGLCRPGSVVAHLAAETGLPSRLSSGVLLRHRIAACDKSCYSIEVGLLSSAELQQQSAVW